MKTTFQKLGIYNFNEVIYEYEAVKLDWWDNDHKTTIEIETYEGEGETVNINIFFCPDLEGVLERTLVLVMFFSNQELQDETLVEKRICENLTPHLAVDFSNEQEAYVIKNIADTTEVLLAITNLTTNKTPVFISDLSDDDTEDLPYEDGDSLDQFIAMLRMNDVPLTKADIIDSLEMGIHFEGKEYLNELRSDIANGPDPDLKEEYSLNNQQLDLIIDTINNYIKPELS